MIPLSVELYKPKAKVFPLKIGDCFPDMGISWGTTYHLAVIYFAGVFN